MKTMLLVVAVGFIAAIPYKENQGLTENTGTTTSTPITNEKVPLSPPPCCHHFVCSVGDCQPGICRLHTRTKSSISAP
jgi:hypothetical protein